MPSDAPETDPDPTRQLTVSRPAHVSILDHAAIVVPGIVAEDGEHAARRFLEFFAATIRNRNTRMAYMTAVSRFFAWCEQHQIGQLADIEPLHVAAYIEALGRDFEKPTVKPHLAGIRMLFDWLVTGQVVATNPAHAVRGPKHVVKTGKTAVLDADQARTLLVRRAAVSCQAPQFQETRNSPCAPVSAARRAGLSRLGRFVDPPFSLRDARFSPWMLSYRRPHAKLVATSISMGPPVSPTS
jgi:hypothetical protein